MNGRAQAAVATEPGTVELRSFPVPPIGSGDGLLAVEACGVCGTDLELLSREQLGRGLGPMILGHETVGRIHDLGPVAQERWGVEPGDRVAVEEFIPCGRCGLCRAGQYRICERTDLRRQGPYLRYGATPTDVAPSLWGGFAELMYLHPDSVIYPVPEGLAPEHATLFVPVSNGIRWLLHEAGGVMGESVAVFGPGLHGLGVVIAAATAGLSPIVVFGLAKDRQRMELARRVGAHYVVAVDEQDPVQAAAEIVGDGGFDIVVDVTPHATNVITQAMEMAGKRGRIALAGSKAGRPTVDFSGDLILRKELRLLGVRGHDRRSVEPALELLASTSLPIADLCTHRFPLSQTDQALGLLRDRMDPTMIHVTLVPDGGSVTAVRNDFPS